MSPKITSDSILEQAQAVTQEEKEGLESKYTVKTIVNGYLIKYPIRFHKIKSTKKVKKNETADESGKLIEEYDLEETTYNKDVYEAAKKLRNEIHKAITKLGAQTSIGIIAPESRKLEFLKTFELCQLAVNQFNEWAPIGSIEFMPTHSLIGASGAQEQLATIAKRSAEILDEVIRAKKADENTLIEMAAQFKTSRAMLCGMSANKVKHLDPEKKRVIVAKLRAFFMRSSIPEIQSFLQLIPQDEKNGLADFVYDLKKRINGITKAAKRDEIAFREAMNKIDIAGISSVQAALIKSAAMAKTKAIAIRAEEIKEELQKPTTKPLEALELSTIELDLPVLPGFGKKQTNTAA